MKVTEEMFEKIPSWGVEEQDHRKKIYSIPDFKNHKKEAMFLFGLWLGDGMRSKKISGFILCIGKRDKKLVEMIVENINQIESESKTRIKESEKDNVTYVCKYNYIFKKWFENRKLFFKTFVKGYEKEVLAGLLQSDGSVLIPNLKKYGGKDIHIEFYNTDAYFFEVVQYCLNNLNIPYKIRNTTQRGIGAFKVNKEQYTLTIRGRAGNYILGQLLFPLIRIEYMKIRITNFLDYWYLLKKDINLPISEIFLAMQGEGTTIGQPQIFIRTEGCNLANICTGCDTKYSWKVNRKNKISIECIIEQIKKYSQIKTVFITGGEPSLRDDEFKFLVAFLRGCGYKIIIQTNGTIWKDILFSIVDKVCMDMKTPSFFENKKEYSNIGFINELRPGKDEIKVVVRDEKDYTYVDKIYKECEKNNIEMIISVFNNVGEDTTEILIERYKKLVSYYLHKGYTNIRILPQMHVLLFGNKRGV